MTQTGVANLGQQNAKLGSLEDNGPCGNGNLETVTIKYQINTKALKG